MIRTADYIAKTLADHQVRHVFMVTGGGAMFLDDAFGSEPRIHCIFNHHEQACAMAAEGYSRVRGQIGVVCVTSGPGGINAINGVFGAWTDSIPLLIISGQVKRETIKSLQGLVNLRQLGDQEVDIISMVKGITKYAMLVDDPNSIRYHLEKAIHIALSGRPGPCWLDIPLDVQSAYIDEMDIAGFEIPQQSLGLVDLIPNHVNKIIKEIQSSERPVILAGNGIRCSKSVDSFRKLVHVLKIPVVASRTAIDVLPYDDEYYIGRSGIDADRAGNFAIQNSDLLIVLGSRLGIRQTGYSRESYARAAKIIHVDIDPAELDKTTIHTHQKIEADLRFLIDKLYSKAIATNFKNHEAWISKCQKYKSRYTTYRSFHNNDISIKKTSDSILNPYEFMERLSELLEPSDTVVCGNGSAFIITAQVAHVKDGQRWFFNSGCASMGYDLPAAIGACVAREKQRVICMAGDGSIMMNLQELQTIATYRLPIKIFIYCNDGYLSIRISQKNFFGRFVGESKSSGVCLPNFSKVAEAFGIGNLRINRSNLEEGINLALNSDGPMLCEVFVDPFQEFVPRSSSMQLPDGRIISAPLEDMFPFLDRDEFNENMIIPIWNPENH